MRGPRSFTDLKTVNGVTLLTFEDSCRARDLIIDDSVWEQTMEEAVSTATAQELRELFAIIIVYCMPPNPVELWTKFKDDMTYDIHRRIQRAYDVNINYTEEMYNECLVRIQSYVRTIANVEGLDAFGLPMPCMDYEDSNAISFEYLRETTFDESSLEEIINNNEPRANPGQKNVIDVIMRDVENEKGNIYYLDAPGGTGK